MKTNFKISLIKYLIEKNYFNLISSDNEPLNFDNSPTSLIKDYQGTSVLLEVIDADQYDNEQLTRIMDSGAAMLNNINGSNASIFKLFLFDETPSEEKIRIIEQGQADIVSEKKFMKCISVNLMNKNVQKLFSVPAFDANIVKSIKRFFSKNLDTRETSIEAVAELIAQRQKDFEIELKAKKPWFTYGLIAINIAVWLILNLISIKTGTAYNELLPTYGAKVNSLILSGEYWRFFTPMFLHGDIIHLALNCFTLYIVGSQVEKLFGHGKFTAIYFISGIIGSIASFAFSTSSSVGASGAIYGLMGAMLFFVLKRPSILKSSFGANLITLLVINIGYSFMNKQIDVSAHLGGLLGGVLTTGVVYTVQEETSKDKLAKLVALILVIVATIGGLFYGFNNERNLFAAKIETMQTYESQQNWAESEKIAEEILTQNPSSINTRLVILLSLSVSEISQQKYGESEDHAEQILNMNLKDEDTRIKALWYVSLAEATQLKFDEAEVHAKQLVELSPKHGHFILGAIYYNTKDFVKAKVELEAAKKLDSPNLDAINNMLTDIENKTGK